MEKNRNHYCPCCASDAVNFDDRLIGDNCVEVNCKCDYCGSTFTQVYNFSHDTAITNKNKLKRMVEAKDHMIHYLKNIKVSDVSNHTEEVDHLINTMIAEMGEWDSQLLIEQR